MRLWILSYQAPLWRAYLHLFDNLITGTNLDLPAQSLSLSSQGQCSTLDHSCGNSLKLLQVIDLFPVQGYSKLNSQVWSHECWVVPSIEPFCLLLLIQLWTLLASSAARVHCWLMFGSLLLQDLHGLFSRAAHQPIWPQAVLLQCVSPSLAKDFCTFLCSIPEFPVIRSTRTTLELISSFTAQSCLWSPSSHH